MYPEKYSIEPTKRSPWIVFEPGRLCVMGRSIIENPSSFYEPALRWVSDFTKSWTGKTKIDLGFEYINTGSIKWLYILIREISELRDMLYNTSINWYYEEGDEDMCELGYILKSLIDCRFSIIEVDDLSNDKCMDLLSQHN